ncbi:MAG: carbohydrate porin [Planctomycetota bacterium]|nr:carbohydrate porin [Planctomycetota bacterium]MDA1106217.1 carbohydrate porin [Planctomycetota bacterium]
MIDPAAALCLILLAQAEPAPPSDSTNPAQPSVRPGVETADGEVETTFFDTHEVGAIDVDLLATLDLSASSGGVSSPNSGAYLLDLTVTADLGALDLLQGGIVFADLQYYNWFGDDPSGVGDYGVWDVINPVLGEELFQLSELWWEQALGSGWTARAGKIDANRFFATVPVAGPFLTLADAMPPTMFGYMPTYPNPAMGVMVSWQSVEDFAASVEGGWSAQVGIFDGTNMAFNPATGSNGPRTGNRGLGSLFDGDWGPYCIAEGGPTYRLNGWSGSLKGGGWLQSGETLTATSAGSSIVHNAAGGYLTITQDLHSPEEQGTRFDMWCQLGFSNPNQSPAAFSVSVGTVCHAPLPGRDSDSAGFMVSSLSMSDNPNVYVAPSGDSGGQETLLEAFYRIDLGHGVALQPDIQYIFNPGGGSPATTEDALIGTLRIEVLF